MNANSELDLYRQLQDVDLELLDCKNLKRGKRFNLDIGTSKVRVRDIIQFFIHMEQLQGAGVSLLDALDDIRGSSDNNQMRDILSDVYRFVSEGGAFSEGLSRHPKVFKHIHITLIKAGEDTGDLTSSYSQLVTYLKWVDLMQRRVRKATRYPLIAMVVVCLVIAVMMGVVVPQIVGFISNLNQEIPFYTKALMVMSEFFQYYWWAIIVTPIILVVMTLLLKKSSASFAYALDSFVLNAPIVGMIIKKVAIARYSQTFGTLYASGIDVINALKSARKTSPNLVMLRAFKIVEQAISNGSPLSKALEDSNEFPSMVVRMIRVGEQSGNLATVLNQVSEFYTQDVDEAIEGVISMIEPLFTAVLGILILWIALAVFGPIYGSFCLLYTSPSPRDRTRSRMPSSA